MTTHKILVVDDDNDFRNIMREFFMEKGLIVFEAATGADAVRAAFAYAPDVVLLDLVLPDMDGCEVCREIKSNERTRDTSVVMISGRAGLKDKLRGFLAGAQKYVAKPCDLNEIETSMRSIFLLHGMPKAAARSLWSADGDYCPVGALLPGTLRLADGPAVEQYADNGVE